MRTELKNGDIVEISTSPQQQPHHDWLNLVGTNRARSKIRSWLKREEKTRAVEVGRKLIERESEDRYFMAQAEPGEELKSVLSSHGLAKKTICSRRSASGGGAPAIIAQLCPVPATAPEAKSP